MKKKMGTSLAIKQLRLSFHCRGAGSIPGWGTKILHVKWGGQKRKKGDATYILLWHLRSSKFRTLTLDTQTGRLGFSGGSVGKYLPANARDGFDP